MKPCCQDEANLSAPETPKADKPELTVRICKCGAKHYEIDADALELNLSSPDLG